MRSIDGVLLDIDGVLAVSWDAIPNAPEALERLRDASVAVKLLTNTTTHTRADLAATLAGAGFDVEPQDIVTAVAGTASYLRTHHPGARVYLLSDGHARSDLEDVALVTDGPVDVVVIGGACDDFSYAALNRVFRMLMDGAELIGMHRNLYWKTMEGWQLDGGAFIAGLEEASGRPAVICGKPAPAFFEEALRLLGTSADRTAMVGDDIVSDVLGGQAAGLTGVLVKTGKFVPADLDKGVPDHVLDSIVDLPDLLQKL